jgi:hypothetical protein
MCRKCGKGKGEKNSIDNKEKDQNMKEQEREDSDRESGDIEREQLNRQSLPCMPSAHMKEKRTTTLQGRLHSESESDAERDD